MTPEERAGMAQAIQEAIALACNAVREEHAQALAEVQRSTDAQLDVMRSAHRASEQRADQLQRDLDDAREALAQAPISAILIDSAGDLNLVQRGGTTLKADLGPVVQRMAQEVRTAVQRSEERADQLQRDLDAAREEAGVPAISAVLVDSDGELNIVQRSGTTKANLRPLLQRMAEEVKRAVAALGGEVRGETVAHVTREALRLGGAQNWSRTAFYGPGSVVSCYVGRTYELREGIAASMAQEPGEHPEVWRRIGSHGLRVMKSKPEALEPGDWFTEGDARFIHDGQTTTLFVPRMLKQADIDRPFKAANANATAALEHAQVARRTAEGLAPRVDRIERTAANAERWIAEEGAEAVLRSATTERWVSERAEELDTLLLDQQQGEAP